MFLFNVGIEFDVLNCVFQAMSDLDALVLAATGVKAGGTKSEVQKLLLLVDVLGMTLFFNGGVLFHSGTPQSVLKIC